MVDCQVTRRGVLQSIGVLVGSGSVTGAVTAQQTSDNWETYGYDPTNTGFSSSAPELTTDIERQWRFSPQDTRISSPAIVGQTAYVNSASGAVYAVDTDSGRTRTYSLGNGGDESNNAEIPAMVRSWVSSPTVEDGVVYVGSTDSTIYAIDIDENQQRWAVQTAAPVIASPTLVDQTLYIADLSGAVYAIDTVSGEKQWDYTADGPVATTPAIDTDTVYVGSGEGTVNAIAAASGEEQWRYEVSSGVYASPSVAGDRVYTGTMDGIVLALDPDGTEAWTQSVDGAITGSPTLVDSQVMIGTHAGSLLAFSGDSGRRAWQQSPGEIASGAVASPETVYVATTDGTVFGYDISDGTRQWQFSTDSTIASTPSLGNGQLLIATETGEVLALGEPSGLAAITAVAERIATNTVDDYGTELATVGAGSVALGAGYLGLRRRGGDTQDDASRRTASPIESVTRGVDADPIVAEPVEEDSDVPDLSSVEYDQFEVQRLIGSGGNANVHRATITVDGETHTVALKTPRMSDYETVDTTFFEDFVSEAQVWESIDDHPSILTVYGWGQQPHPWIALEYMEDGSFDQALADFSVSDLFGHLEAICEAVYHAHRQGITHTDLKPENILLTTVGDRQVAKIADWGLATVLLDHSTSVEGLTPAYSAPEQIDPEAYGGTDDQTDIYQLGVVAYEAFTGQLPFEYDSSSAVINAVLNESPTPPTEIEDSLPSELDEVLLRALAKEKADRYETVLHFRDALRRVFHGTALEESD